MPSEEAKEQKNNTKEDTTGAISKQDQNPAEVKESIISKDKKEEPYEEQELQNGTNVVNENGMETISTKKRNKEAEGENENDFEDGVEASSTVSAMDGNSGNDSDSECVEKDEESSAKQESDSNGLIAHKRNWEPMICYWPGKEIHYFLDHKITIEESIDSYGAVIWPAAVALCKYLETTDGQKKINLLDKTVLELGAGTGLLSIVATLLGAKLTASDLPEILGNLRCNLNRNTRMLRRHEPQVIELSWGNKLEETFPHCTYHYDYVLAADVVYHHNFLDELLATMHHFCQPGTTLIWANKIRYPTDLEFAKNFQKMFDVTLLEELDEIRIYSATHKSSEENPCVRG